jgi:hypothetical protein
MDGAKKVMIGGVAIIGIIVIGPLLPGMLAKAAKGTFSLGQVFGGEAIRSYRAGVRHGQRNVTSGIKKPI